MRFQEMTFAVVMREQKSARGKGVNKLVPEFPQIVSVLSVGLTVVGANELFEQFTEIRNSDKPCRIDSRTALPRR